jgi:hypothetical protein
MKFKKEWISSKKYGTLLIVKLRSNNEYILCESIPIMKSNLLYS